VPGLLVVLGGAAGAPSRWYLDQFVQTRHRSRFPWGTYAINMIGSFVLGVLLGATAAGLDAHPWVPLVGTGFCGAFTTFSTFGFETVRLAEEGEYGPAARNVGASLGVGLVAAVAGWQLGRLLHG
jgi:CrcB protein